MSATWLSHLEHQLHSLAWRPWLEAFSRTHTLLRYDCRGCGLSDRGKEDLSFENWISDFERVVGAAGLSQFDLLATCWGGPVAIEYAARHPERVRRLVLYGTYARGRFRRQQPEEVEKARLLIELTRLGWGRENHAFAQVWASTYQPGGSLDHFKSWCDQQCAATSAETAVRLLEVGWDVDVRAAARNVKCPVLILHADRDVVVPIEESRILASLIPDSRFVQLDTENHMPLANELAWQHIVTAIEDFLSEPAGTAVRTGRALPLNELTPRERNVLEGIASGLDNKEIAVALKMSEKTVRNHITHIFAKIQVAHRYEAIVRAREAGLGTGLYAGDGPGHLSQV
jgi:pimeloyl-ACP methyl ester carboxylesterase/DNA-binding CsgD family transcriptional regulator